MNRRWTKVLLTTAAGALIAAVVVRFGLGTPRVVLLPVARASSGDIHATLVISNTLSVPVQWMPVLYTGGEGAWRVAPQQPQLRGAYAWRRLSPNTAWYFSVPIPDRTQYWYLHCAV